MSRIATIVSVAIVGWIGCGVLNDEGVEHAPLVVVCAGLLACGLVALMSKI